MPKNKINPMREIQFLLPEDTDFGAELELQKKSAIKRVAFSPFALYALLAASAFSLITWPLLLLFVICPLYVAYSLVGGKALKLLRRFNLEKITGDKVLAFEYTLSKTIESYNAEVRLLNEQIGGYNRGHVSGRAAIIKKRAELRERGVEIKRNRDFLKWMESCDQERPPHSPLELAENMAELDDARLELLRARRAEERLVEAGDEVRQLTQGNDENEKPRQP